MKSKALCLSLLALASCVVSSLALAQRASGPTEWAPGRIIIAERAGVTPSQLESALRPHGGRARRLGNSHLHVVQLPPGVPETTVARLLERHPLLQFAELDYKVRPALVANDPLLPSQWHLSKTRTDSAWDSATGAGLTIAIIDTGVSSSHPDLAPNLVAGWNTFDNSANWEDAHGHGTTTAGTAAAVLNNATGVAGVAGGAKIMPIRATDAAAVGYYSTIANGITYAADRGARIASASFAYLFKSSTIINAANYMKSKGGVVVVAAGNNGVDEASPETNAMVVVSATDSADGLAGWSSYGNMVSVAAPGVGIYTTSMGGGYSSMSGTSYAAPATAGVLALIMSANPSLSASQAQSILFQTATDIGAPGRDPYFGYGRVDAAAAVAQARSTTAGDTQKPSVAITNPAGGNSVSGMVPVDVSASDNVGVTRVDLLANGVVVASDSAAPFAFSWDTSKSSSGVTLTAVAYDAAGNAATSSAVSVTVSNTVTPDTTAPTINSFSLVEGAQVSGTVAIRATATDDQGAANLMQTLFIDGVQVAATTGGSFSYSWNTRKVARGPHTVTLRVTDRAGNATTRTVNVSKLK